MARSRFKKNNITKENGSQNGGLTCFLKKKRFTHACFLPPKLTPAGVRWPEDEVPQVSVNLRGLASKTRRLI